MPIFDGIELTRMIRNPDGFSQAYLPIIILSAYSEKHQVISARDAGASDFICKPVSATTLYNRIENIIQHPRPFIRTTTYFGPDRRRQENVFSGEEKRVVDSEEFIQIPD